MRLSLAFGLSACLAMADTPAPPRKPPTGTTPAPKAVPPAKLDGSLGAAVLLEASALGTAGPAEEKLADRAPVAAARFEGVATEGGQVRLSAEGSVGPSLRYRWHQTSGPLAELIDPDRATARVKIPEGASSLGFLLVVSNPQGMDSIPLTIPVEDRPEVANGDAPRAHAGDDQIGFVGRQITLNGSRSEPRNKVGYRWIQTGGPKVGLKIAKDHYFSFVATEPGEAKFALVVASGSVISEPDEVVVNIDYGPSAAPRVERQTRPAPAPDTTGAISRVAEEGTAALRVDAAVAGSLSQTFESVADRMGLYRCYDETFSEISRRLDEFIPQDDAVREQWVRSFFIPITNKLVEELRKEGLDLATPSGRAASLSRAQKARLADVFRAIAQGAKRASKS